MLHWRDLLCNSFWCMKSSVSCRFGDFCKLTKPGLAVFRSRNNKTKVNLLNCTRQNKAVAWTAFAVLISCGEHKSRYRFLFLIMGHILFRMISPSPWVQGSWVKNPTLRQTHCMALFSKLITFLTCCCYWILPNLEYFSFCDVELQDFWVHDFVRVNGSTFRFLKT